MKRTSKQLLVAASIGGLCVSIMTPAHAALVFSYEAPGVQATTVAGVTTETFDSRPLGALSGNVLNNTATLSAGGAVVAGTANSGAFGGAGTGAPGSETQYYAVGVQSGSAAPVTLEFNTPQKYFGMWWPAGDAKNELSFYDGSNNLLGYYTVGTILASLPASYNGNPNNGLDAAEKFAYLNFTATGSDSIKKVVFANSGSLSSGFEMDNFSITTESITPPGTVVPEPSTYIAGALLTLPFALKGLRRLRNRKQAA